MFQLPLGSFSLAIGLVGKELQVNTQSVSGCVFAGNGEPADHPVSPKDMMGTIFHTLFDMGQLRVARGLPRDLIQKMENMKPIEGLA